MIAPTRTDADLIRIYSISTYVDHDRTFVSIRDDEDQEVSRLEALSREHARKVVKDCALLVVKRSHGGLVIDRL